MTPTAHQRLVKARQDSRVFEVQASSQDEAMVSGNGRSYRVVLTEMMCDCGLFREMNMPCCHACAFLIQTDRDPVQYCCSAYATDTWQLTYAHNIPVVTLSEIQAAAADNNCRAPTVCRARGRPKKARLRKSREQSVSDNLKHCAACGRQGHNRRTCRQEHMSV